MKLGLVFTIVFAVAMQTLDAYVLMSVPEALEKAFGAAKIEHKPHFLSAEQLARARQLAGENSGVESALVTEYTARLKGKIIGYAYLDTHVVRTRTSTIMVALDTKSRVLSIQILSFLEPLDYIVPQNWLRQFVGRILDSSLSSKGDIHPITGATLSDRAIIAATRRVLALHQVIHGK